MAGLRKWVVAGGGPAGYEAAFAAAGLGYAVEVADPEGLGGTCLRRGCIPSKALLRAVEVARAAREGGRLGVTGCEGAGVSAEGARAWKEGVVAQLEAGLARMAKAKGVEVTRGRLKWGEDGKARIFGEDGSVRETGEARILVAAGSTPVHPAGWPWGHPGMWDSTDALEVRRVPARLVVVGGGAIGVELGQVYAGLGSQVTLVELAAGLLPAADRDLVVPLLRRLRAAGIAVHAGTSVEGVAEAGEGLRVTLWKGEETWTVEADAVLAAAGRGSAWAGLNAAAAGVELDARGWAKAGEDGRIAEGVWAAGDCAGGILLAHKAMEEGVRRIFRVAWEEDGLEAARREAEARRGEMRVPSVVYGDPEVAWCGWTEARCKAEGVEYAVGKSPWGGCGRAVASGCPEGTSKWIWEKGSGRLLGAGMSGAGAGELIGEAVMALACGATAADVARAVHPHPTFCETLKTAAAAGRFDGLIV